MKKTASGLMFLLLIGGAGCAGGTLRAGEDIPKPTMLALSQNEIRVGQPLEFLGGSFISGKQGHTEVHFQGTFTSDSGQTSDVDFRYHPHWADGNRLLWANVGPYQVPFTSDGGQMGIFTGQVSAVNISDTQVEAESEPITVTIKVLPSIIVRDLQPLMAQCDQPAKRLLGLFPYKVTVEAVGFTPVNWSYVIGGEPGSQRPRILRHVANGATDVFGMNNELFFAPVPDEMIFYVANFSITALDTNGLQHAINLEFAVHRPIEYIDSGEVKIAEIEAPVVAYGCMSGGDTNGRTVTYTETETDTRMRSIGVTWNEDWATSHSEMNGGSHTETNGINTSVMNSQTQGWAFGWNAGVSNTLEGGISLGIDAKDALTLSVGVNGQVNGSVTNAYTVGRDYSTSDTESWAFTDTRSHSVSQGGMDFWTVSSSTSTSLAFTGLILPGRFGVFYRQTTRLALPGSIVAYNLCGVAQVVAQTNFYDYTWSVELASGGQCPPFPASSLPAPQCFIAPCSGLQ